MQQYPGMNRRAILAAKRCCEPLALPVSPQTAGEDAQLFRALGDETRVQIVRLLAQQSEPLCACYIEGAFTLSQPTISHHLKALREAGLVTTERRGVWIYYRLDRERLGVIQNFLQAILGDCADGREADHV